MKPWQREMDRYSELGAVRDFLGKTEAQKNADRLSRQGGLDATYAMFDMMPQVAAGGMIASRVAGKGNLTGELLNKFKRAVMSGDNETIKKATTMFPELNDYKKLVKRHADRDHLPDADMAIAKNIRNRADSAKVYPSTDKVSMMDESFSKQQAGAMNRVQEFGDNMTDAKLSKYADEGDNDPIRALELKKKYKLTDKDMLDYTLE